MEHDIIIITSENTIGSRAKVSIGPIAKVLRTPAGKQALAASMAQPLRTTLDYHGLSRRVLMVDQLPPGALPIYTKDEEDV